MTEIGIYGAGAYGRAFLSAMRDQGVEPDFFVDQYCPHEEVSGMPVRRVDDVQDRSARIFISVALVPLSTDPETDIVGRLQASGFSDVVSFEESLHCFPRIVDGIFDLEYLWMRRNPAQMLDHDRLTRVANLMSDDSSRDLLTKIIAFRSEPTAEKYVPPDGQLEYFPDDVDVFSSMDAVRFVDCGAYVGDTIAELGQRLTALPLDLEFAVSFEPDARNYRALTEELRLQQGSHPDARFFACCQGVWSSNDVLHFNAAGASSSSLSTSGGQEGTTSVPVVSLDDMFGAAAPNFIKMDIEGAEREAILGAQRLIRESAPVLAICVYHRPEDLWDLPLLIADINPDYDMYLRAHSHMGLSTVLYCVPRQATATQ